MGIHLNTMTEKSETPTNHIADFNKKRNNNCIDFLLLVFSCFIFQNYTLCFTFKTALIFKG